MKALDVCIIQLSVHRPEAQEVTARGKALRTRYEQVYARFEGLIMAILPTCKREIEGCDQLLREIGHELVGLDKRTGRDKTARSFDDQTSFDPIRDRLTTIQSTFTKLLACTLGVNL